LDFMFFLNSLFLGIGLAMDAFSVSVVNAAVEPGMGRLRRAAIAGVYAFFQFAMPMAGWFCVHTVAEAFRSFQPFIPWIALGLLLFIGGKMLWEAVRGGGEEASRSGAEEDGGLSLSVLLLQGVATSIDALSVGFTIAGYGTAMALVASLVIAAVTFAICMAGLLIGRAAAGAVSGRSQVVGGVILILIGIEIFIRGLVA
jgi:putative Mn2+ efflux pump MntP